MSNTVKTVTITEYEFKRLKNHKHNSTDLMNKQKKEIDTLRNENELLKRFTEYSARRVYDINKQSEKFLRDLEEVQPNIFKAVTTEEDDNDV